MNIRPSRSEDDYRSALRTVLSWFDREPDAGTEDADQFDILLTRVEAYEARHFPLAQVLVTKH